MKMIPTLSSFKASFVGVMKRGCAPRVLSILRGGARPAFRGAACFSAGQASLSKSIKKCLETRETTKSLENGKCLETGSWVGYFVIMGLQKWPLSPKVINFPQKYALFPQNRSFNRIYITFSLSKMIYALLSKIRESHLRDIMGQIVQDAWQGNRQHSNLITPQMFGTDIRMK